MIHFTLNIGLHVGRERAQNSERMVRARANIAEKALDGFLGANGSCVCQVLPDGQEPTLVVAGNITRIDRLSNWELQNFIYDLAVALHQDCIAAEANGVGQLIGPHADAWGDFNNDLFRRLAA